MIEAALTLQLAGLTAQPMLFFLLVVALTFILEDATALAVGTLGAAMHVDHGLALAALLIGTIVGDGLLHGLGRVAGRHPAVLQRVAAGGRLAGSARSVWVVAAARFVPGLRLPAYIGSGVVRMPMLRFLAAITLTGLLWTPLLYFAPRLLQSAGLGLAPVAVLALALLLVPRLVRRVAQARSPRPA